MMGFLLLAIGLGVGAWVAYKGYKYGQSRGHKWIGLLVAIGLWVFIVGPIFWMLFWWIAGKLGMKKPAVGVGSGAA